MSLGPVEPVEFAKNRQGADEEEFLLVKLGLGIDGYHRIVAAAVDVAVAGTLQPLGGRG